MTDHENPEPQPPTAPGPGAPGPGAVGATGEAGDAGEGPELVAVTVALTAVPDPPPGRLEHAVRAALTAYDEAHGRRPAGGDRPGEEQDGEERGSRREEVVVPLPGRRSRGAATHRRLAAVAAALVVLAGLTGLLVAGNPLRSTVGDTQVMSQEAALDPQATTTMAPPAGPRAATAAGAAPATTTPADALTSAAAVAAPPTLGSYTDPASLVARVRAEAPAPLSDDPAPAAEDSGTARDTSQAVCGGSDGTPLGDALIGATRVLVILEAASSGASTGPSTGAATPTSTVTATRAAEGAPTRIRVYVAADCALLLDEPLAG